MNCFYEDGLRFSCVPHCRYCCGVEPGYVFLCEEDIKRLSSHLHLSRQEFIETYCRRDSEVGDVLTLLEKPDFDCIFLGDDGCTVYQARPEQCRTYPFWDTILKDRRTWNKEEAWCPGINQGELHSKEEIEEARKRSLMRHQTVKE